jgi:PIN domain nuclease of toxin-antitoxin system
MDYVTDTHSILWYFTEDPRLSKRAFDVFEGTVREGFIIIPAVVLAEIMFIAKKGRITLTFEETLKKIERYENFDTFDGAKPRFLNRGKKRHSVSTLSIPRASDRGVEWVDLAPLDVDILKVANKIEADLEMHDRLIVATALYFNATLITRDRQIGNASICPTIW